MSDTRELQIPDLLAQVAAGVLEPDKAYEHLLALLQPQEPVAGGETTEGMVGFTREDVEMLRREAERSEYAWNTGDNAGYGEDPGDLRSLANRIEALFQPQEPVGWEYTCPRCGDRLLSYLDTGERCLCLNHLTPLNATPVYLAAPAATIRRLTAEVEALNKAGLDACRLFRAEVDHTNELEAELEAQRINHAAECDALEAGITCLKAEVEGLKADLPSWARHLDEKYGQDIRALTAENGRLREEIERLAAADRTHTNDAIRFGRRMEKEMAENARLRGALDLLRWLHEKASAEEITFNLKSWLSTACEFENWRTRVDEFFATEALEES